MFRQRLGQFLSTLRNQGARVAVRKSVDAVMAAAPGVIAPKQDVIGDYGAILGEELGYGLTLTDENIPKGSMTWLIPDFNASSGGHINLFRMMALLKDRGFSDQHVVVMEPHRWASAEQAKAALDETFGDHGITISLGVESIEPCDFIVATGWQTAYWVSKYRDARKKLYFVQDFEPSFYANGSEYVLAENTYRLGLTGITAGSWLKDVVESYGMNAVSYEFACDSSFYKQTEKRPSAVRNIFFYARPVTPRRCFEIGLLALDKICKKYDDVAVIFAGWDVSNYAIPFHHLNGGSIPLEELPDLYSQCDVSLVLSATNLSLLPLEIASCGCPLVMNRGPNSEWLLTEDEALYCDLSVDGIVDSLSEVLDKPKEAQARAVNAKKRVTSGSWGLEADKVASYLKKM